MLNDTPAVRSKNRRVKAYSPPNPFEFPLGDARVLITYKNTEVTAIVSSHALSLCSPVWKNFLYPPWSEPQMEQNEPNCSQGAKPKMHCREDNAEALLILFNIAHIKFSEVPLTLSTLLLYEVAILCDQYDCVEMVAPWLSGWTKDEDQECCGKEYAKWMLISWVFGRTRSLRRSVSCILRNLKIDEKGQPFLASGQELPRMLPHGALESILKVRTKTLSRLLKVPYIYLRKSLLAVKVSEKSMCKLVSADATTRRLCDFCFLESILNGFDDSRISPQLRLPNLHTLKEWTQYKSSNMDRSINETAETISGVDVSMTHWHYLTDGKHLMCKPGSFSNHIDAILDNIRTPVRTCHKVHMEGQIEKLRNKTGPITWEPEKQK